MKGRIISTICLWGAVFGVILTNWLPGYYLLFNFIAVVGLLEYYHFLKREGARLAYGSAVIATVLLITGIIYLHQSHGEVAAWAWSSGIFTALCLWVLCASMWCAGERSPLETVGGTLSGFIYVPWLSQFMVLIVFGIPQIALTATGGFYLLYLLIVTKLCDTGALLTGMAFGKHKMSPRISPKKTWEGLVGGILTSVLASFLFAHFFHGTKLLLISPAEAIGLGFVLAVASVIGDLAESYLKRGAHIKDSGNIIPGIGGILDLIDSLLFTGPVLYFYLRFFTS
ncbi:MAG: CDP-archaeol synthase [Verrucomicrobiota bacterium]|nr:CDP-archaeol synthase [Verrucomicrobiota bacterium]